MSLMILWKLIKNASCLDVDASDISYWFEMDNNEGYAVSKEAENNNGTNENNMTNEDQPTITSQADAASHLQH